MNNEEEEDYDDSLLIFKKDEDGNYYFTVSNKTQFNIIIDMVSYGSSFRNIELCLTYIKKHTVLGSLGLSIYVALK